MALGQFYHVAVCTKKPYFVYGGLQDNGCWGVPSMSLRGIGPVNEDVISLNGGDGYVCRVDPNDPDQVYAESQNGGMVRYNLRTGEKASIKPQARGGPAYRFNWNTPYILSAANSQILYSAGNFVFKSVHKGDNPQVYLTRHHAYQERHRHRAWPNRRVIRMCSGPGPTTATSGSPRTAARTGPTSPRKSG